MQSRPLLRVLVVMSTALRLAGAFLVVVPGGSRAQHLVPPSLHPLKLRYGARSDRDSGRGLRYGRPTAGAGVHGSTHEDGACDGEQSAAGRRRFAEKLISALVEGTATQRFPDAVGLWLEAPQATKEERHALAGVWIDYTDMFRLFSEGQYEREGR